MISFIEFSDNLRLYSNSKKSKSTNRKQNKSLGTSSNKQFSSLNNRANNQYSSDKHSEDDFERDPEKRFSSLAKKYKNQVRNPDLENYHVDYEILSPDFDSASFMRMQSQTDTSNTPMQERKIESQITDQNDKYINKQIVENDHIKTENKKISIKSKKLIKNKSEIKHHKKKVAKLIKLMKKHNDNFDAIQVKPNKGNPKFQKNPMNLDQENETSIINNKVLKTKQSKSTSVPNSPEKEQFKHDVKISESDSKKIKPLTSIHQIQDIDRMNESVTRLLSASINENKAGNDSFSIDDLEEYDDKEKDPQTLTFNINNRDDKFAFNQTIDTKKSDTTYKKVRIPRMSSKDCDKFNSFFDKELDITPSINKDLVHERSVRDYLPCMNKLQKRIIPKQFDINRERQFGMKVCNEVQRKLANSRLSRKRPMSVDDNRKRSTQQDNLKNKIDIVFRTKMKKYEECGNRLTRQWKKDFAELDKPVNQFQSDKDVIQYDDKYNSFYSLELNYTENFCKDKSVRNMINKNATLDNFLNKLNDEII